MTNLVWFRRDLRVADHPALTQACQYGSKVIAVFILTIKTWQRHHMGVVQQAALKSAITALSESLARLGVPLYLLQVDYFSDCPNVLHVLAQQHGIKAIFCHREYPWDERRRDQRVKQWCEQAGIGWHCLDDAVLTTPEEVTTRQGRCYTVFTPYKKSVLPLLAKEAKRWQPLPVPQPNKMVGAVAMDAASQSVLAQWLTACSADLGWLTLTESGGWDCLQRFTDELLLQYAQVRDFPAQSGSSKLSPYLALGLLSSRQCLSQAVHALAGDHIDVVLQHPSAAVWLSELLWRDFYRMICWQFPHVSRGRCFKLEYDRIAWSEPGEGFQRWCDGETGIPIVDSGMRQLNQYGWMHNRLRMVVAMFLSKNLWVDWRHGEAYFAQRLVDWDFAANNGGWQWSASTGTDAAPYFRVFNPVSQSERFDAEGQFIRHYCPELASLSAASIHAPWQCDNRGLDYPSAMVDLKQSRLAAIERMRVFHEQLRQ